MSADEPRRESLGISMRFVQQYDAEAAKNPTELDARMFLLIQRILQESEKHREENHGPA